MKKYIFLFCAIIIFLSSCATYINGKRKLVDKREKQKYKVVMIGTHVWMVENLKFAMEKSWNYENNDSIGVIQGRLYKWTAATNACPKCWHLLSDYDWKTLESSDKCIIMRGIIRIMHEGQSNQEC